MKILENETKRDDLLRHNTNVYQISESEFPSRVGIHLLFLS
jgi:hypothetical protein